MNLKNALKSIIRPHENDRLTPLTTVWGEALDHNNVLPEYPRPQLRRDSFLSLNGYWDYAITQEATPPLEFDGKILVPFSPESTLSGIKEPSLPSPVRFPPVCALFCTSGPWIIRRRFL